MKVPVAVLASGSGTNLQAILDHCADSAYPARVACVVVNRRRAGAIQRAERMGVPVHFVSHRGRPRDDFETELVAVLREHGARWVALAGFMRLLGSTFLTAFPGRVLNIHPALLPAFPGLHAQERAWARGVRIAGATVHLVDAGTDTGPIVAQAAVPVHEEDDAEALAARILAAEHRLFPMALRWAVEDRLRVEDGRVHVDLPPGEHTWIWAP